MTAQSSKTTTDETQVSDHLDDIDDGCGCAEIWEHLSESRDGDD